MALKFSTFNCRGIQDSFKRKSILSFFHKKGDDIIFLQETHASISNEKFWGSQWGGHCWFSSFASNSRGVGILIKGHKISVNSIQCSILHMHTCTNACTFSSVQVNFPTYMHTVHAIF